jgi:ADP-heptose:LPS heptosyltransferase
MTIAVVSFKQLGDIIMLEPLTRLLAQRSGEPVDLFVKHDFAPVVGLMELARAKMWSPKRYEWLLALHEGTKASRRAVSLMARKKTLIVSNPLTVRWEHSLVYGEVLVRPAGIRYMARFFFEEAGGDPAAFSPPELARPPESWRPVRWDLPDRYVVVHPTAAWLRKYWTAEAWAAVIDALHAANVEVVLSGGPMPMDRRHCHQIVEQCRRKPIAMAGQTSIAEYAWLIANATGLVAIDGSACHLADAFKVPAVKLFGQTSELSWHYDRANAWLVLSGPGRLSQRPLAAETPLSAVMEGVEAMLAAVKRRPSVAAATS